MCSSQCLIDRRKQGLRRPTKYRASLQLVAQEYAIISVATSAADLPLSQACAMIMTMKYATVIFDFYGTVATRDGKGLNLDALLRERGHRLDASLAREYWQEGFDGTTHDEASQSRDHYTKWQRSRLLSLLDRSAVPTSTAAELAELLADPSTRGSMVPYPESHEVLAQLRGAGIQTAICSNWDWDLTEAIEASMLQDHFDFVVSSAWVGARKPHARIFEHTINALGANPETTLFVGDTWNCDVEGPSNHGLTPVYVRRPGREVDHTHPLHTTTDAVVGDVHVFEDLRPIVELCTFPTKLGSNSNP